jgi:hypothetical protein
MDQVFLVGEVVVQLTLAHLRSCPDVIERGARDAVLEHQLGRRVEDATASRAALRRLWLRNAHDLKDSVIWTIRSK